MLQASPAHPIHRVLVVDDDGDLPGAGQMFDGVVTRL